MMRSSKLLFSLLIFCVASSFAQPKIVPVKGGAWKFTQYAANIIKVTFKPDGYATDENISDAVILKPLGKLQLPVQVSYHSVTVGENKKVRISVPENLGEFKGLNFTLNPEEKIYGGGERALPLNRRGYKFNLYNNPWYGYGEGADNLNYSVPFFTSSRGYGLFFDNASKGYADIGKTDPDIFETGFISGEINVYVIFGNDYKEILSSYHKLTGTQPLPPRWALGNFMSRFGYSSQAQVTDIMARMKEQHIPVDAVIFDLFWFGDSIKSTMGNLAWVNKEKWPDPKAMIAGFRKQNVNTILITEPFILQSSSNYENSKQYHSVDSNGKPYLLTDFYFGKGGLIDIFRKDSKDWFWKKHEEQMKIGVESWWGDLGEPEKHPADLYHNLKDMGYKRLFKANEVHNIYGHNWTKMLYDHYAKKYPSKRLFSLNRSGFSGSQRYGIFPWSGDVSRSWSGLRAQLPIMLGMSMSGVPYIHADAGGFAGGEGDSELYVRWLQFATFTPVFRPHGTALYEIDKNAFSFPSEPALIDEPYRDYVKKTIRLRYELLPYNYSLSYLQATKGEPLVAPLYYSYSMDTTIAKVEDEFMWGKNILVAPVLNKGATERKISLPAGKWYKLNSGENSTLDFKTYSGSVTENTDIRSIPVFVKAGSFIPMVIKNEGANSVDYSTDSLTVHYFSSADNSSDIMYDDDGVNKNSLKDNKYELIRFRATPSKKSLKFTVTSAGGRLKKRNITFVVHGPVSTSWSVYINGRKKDIQIPYFGRETGPADLYQFIVDYSGKPLNIEIK